MKIGITGTDSVGKSTLVGRLRPSLAARGLNTEILSIGNLAKQSPYPLVAKQTLKSSLWILDQVRTCEREAQNACEMLICDRTALDVWVFSEMARGSGYISSDEMVVIETLVSDWLPTYSFIFVATIDRDVPISLGNIPDGDLRLRDYFDATLMLGLDSFAKATQCKILPSSLLERVASIENDVLKYFQ
jgi:hypothetical protein